MSAVFVHCQNRANPLMVLKRNAVLSFWGVVGETGDVNVHNVKFYLSVTVLV